MLGEMILGLMWLARTLSNIEGKSAVLLVLPGVQRFLCGRPARVSGCLCRRHMIGAWNRHDRISTPHQTTSHVRQGPKVGSGSGPSEISCVFIDTLGGEMGLVEETEVPFSWFSTNFGPQASNPRLHPGSTALPGQSQH